MAEQLGGFHPKYIQAITFNNKAEQAVTVNVTFKSGATNQYEIEVKGSVTVEKVDQNGTSSLYDPIVGFSTTEGGVTKVGTLEEPKSIERRVYNIEGKGVVKNFLCMD